MKRQSKKTENDRRNPPIEKKTLRTSLRFKIYFLILFNLLLFANTLFNRFTYDDAIYIVGNPHIQNPGNIFTLFLHTYPPHRPELSLYRPLVELTYLLDWCRSLRASQFADLNFNDRIEMPLFHLTNIAFHIATVLTLLFLVRRLLKNETAAFVTALIFSAHPVHVETVTSIVGRAESMSAFFFLFSLYIFIKEEKRERLISPFLLLSYLMFFFALLSKESAITLPVVILITPWFLRMIRVSGEESPELNPAFMQAGDQSGTDNTAKGKGVWKKAFLRTLPYGGIFILYMIIRLAIVGKLGINPSGYYFRNVTTAARLAAMCTGFLAYLRLLILPISMSIDYNFPLRIAGPLWVDQPDGFMNFWVLVGLVVIIIYLFFIFLTVKKKSALSYPLLFFLITLFPFSNIMPFGDFIAERFLYLPSLGYCLLTGIFYIHFRQSMRYRKIVLFFLVALLGFYTVRTFLRNSDWRSGIQLWKAEAKQNPRNPIIYSGLGAEYMVERKEQLIQGNVYRKKGDFKKSAYHLEIARDYEKKALEFFEIALQEDPKNFMACYNYGCLSVEMMEPDIKRAEEILLQGASCMPDNLGSLHVFYYYLGLVNFKRNPPNLERALMFLQKSYQLKKSSDTVLIHMAVILGKMWRSKEALAAIRKVLERNPGNRKAVKVLKIIRLEEQNKNKRAQD